MSYDKWKFRQHIGEDVEDNDGCLRPFCTIAVLVFLFVFFSFCLNGCKAVKVGASHDRDSIRTEMRVDTFTRVVRDSVRVQLPCSDTIEVAYIDRWHKETIVQKSIERDTVRVCTTDTIRQPYPVEKVVVKNSGFARFCIWVVVILFVILLLNIAWRIFKVLNMRV